MSGAANNKKEVLEILRTAGSLRDEEEAWTAIQSAVENAARPAQGAQAPQRFSEYIYRLALIYSYQTGAMPGFSNGDNETRFERFAFAIQRHAGIPLKRSTLKSEIRRLDAKRNVGFLIALKNMSEPDAAE